MKHISGTYYQTTDWWHCLNKRTGEYWYVCRVINIRSKHEFVVMFTNILSENIHTDWYDTTQAAEYFRLIQKINSNYTGVLGRLDKYLFDHIKHIL